MSVLATSILRRLSQRSILLHVGFSPSTASSKSLQVETSRKFCTSSSTTKPSTTTATNEDDNNSTTTSSSPASSSPGLPPPLPSTIHNAISDMNSLSEVKQAMQTSDASLRQTLLSRVFQILTGSAASHINTDLSKSPPPLSSSPPEHVAVAHALLARHAHVTGDVPTERAHRVHALHALSAVQPSDPKIHSVIACAHASLALCCLRATGAEMRFAAAAAAANAERMATGTRMRLCATLLSAAAASSPKRAMLLSALTAVDEQSESQQPDAAGFARYLLACDNEEQGNQENTAKDQALALVTRWDNGQQTHDFIEALVLAARIVMHVKQVDKTQQNAAMNMAEDLLSRALQEADRVGNVPDKAEPLLGLAKLYAARGAPVQAEGFFRGAQDALEPMWKRRAFTVPSAHLYLRLMEEFASFLDSTQVNGRKRDSDIAQKRDKAKYVRELFPHILGDVNSAPGMAPWIVESMLPYFDLELPL